MSSLALNIIYRHKRYSWSDLKQAAFAQRRKINLLNNRVIFYPYNNNFDTCLLFILGYKQHLILSPQVTSLSEQQIKRLQTKLSAKHWANLRLAIPTSGTQAKPKISLISKSNINAHCLSFNHIIPLNNQSIWLNCMPLTHIAGIMIFYRCLYHKASMLLHDKFNPQQVWSDIINYKVTHISLVPIMLARLLDQSRDKNGDDTSPAKSLKYVLIGGGRLSDYLYQRAIKASWPILISYAMTEATSTIAIGKEPEKLQLLPGFTTQLGENTILKIKAPMVHCGYVDQINEVKHSEWFETNDVVEISDNHINILGRNDDMIISGGLTINPRYIEELILSSREVNGFISDLFISKKKHSQWGDSIAAYVVGDIKKLERWVTENMESKYRPRYFIQLDSLDKLKRKKFNYHKDSSALSDPTFFSLKDNKVDVWICDAKQVFNDIEYFFSILSITEQQRAQRFKFEVHQQRFIVSHGFKRIILSKYLNIPPVQLQFYSGKKGKPFISPMESNFDSQKIQFNLSHTEDLTLLAITQSAEIGIDIETISRKTDWQAISQRFFTAPEQKRLFSLTKEQQKRAFYQLWTRKEAYMKVLGSGLSLAPTEFTLTVPPIDPKLITHHGQKYKPDREVYFKQIELPHIFKSYCATLASLTMIKEYSFEQFF